MECLEVFESGIVCLVGINYDLIVEEVSILFDN